MKVFVTGGTGFLGRHVVDGLLAQGHEVRASLRDARAQRWLPNGAEPIAVGLETSTPLASALRGVDAVIHLAGKVSRDPKDASEMHWLHVEATRNLLDAMQQAEVRRLILASTSGTIAVRASAGRPATEADQASLEIIGRWPYYLSKRFQEQEVLRWDAAGRIEAVILNPSLLLGPGDHRLSSTGDVLKILHGRVPAVTLGTAAIVDVRDAALAFSAALTLGRPGQRYLLNGANLSVRSFAERVALAGGVPSARLVVPERLALAGAKLVEGLFHAIDRAPPIDATSVDIARHHWACSAQKAKTELGFRPRDPQMTIVDTVRDLEARGAFRRRAAG